jgi:MoaA/NifB/PqqE/SkfB family radical SAM enzyme
MTDLVENQKAEELKTIPHEKGTSLAVKNTRELTYEITGKCNLNCIHCSTDAKISRDDKVDYETFIGKIDLLEEYQVVRLS